MDIRPVTFRRKLAYWVDVALRSFPADTWANAWKRILCKPEEEMSILEAAFVDHRAKIRFRCQRGRAQAPESQHMDGLRFDDTCPPCEHEDAEEGEEDLFAADTDVEWSGDEFADPPPKISMSAPASS